MCIDAQQGGLLEQSGAALERCYDDSLWDVAPGGDWILHRCLSRLGFPLTPMDGMHQLDSSAAADTRDVLERHPVNEYPDERKLAIRQLRREKIHNLFFTSQFSNELPLIYLMAGLLLHTDMLDTQKEESKFKECMLYHS